MREGNPVAGQAAPGPGRRRLRLASPSTVLVLGGLVLALLAAAWPFAGLAHLKVNAGTDGSPWWSVIPFGVVGFVVAWRKPGNLLGWCLVGGTVAAALSEDGSLYAVPTPGIPPPGRPRGTGSMSRAVCGGR
jgi:hypothetical protein